MRLVFMGTPDFAAEALTALHKQGHEIAAVFTKEDTPKRRGMKMLPSPVKMTAEALGIAEIYQPKSFKEEGVVDSLAALSPEVVVVAAYGLLLPKRALDIPKYGCLNIHASLLPRYRGASPINACILNGDSESGISIMRMEAGLDTGDVLLQMKTPLTPRETVGKLHDRLAAMGAESIVTALELIAAGRAEYTPQDSYDRPPSYASKIKKEDCGIDFDDNATRVSAKIRAYDPFPGGYAALGGERVKLFGGYAIDAPAEKQPGCIEAIDENGVTVSCKENKVLIESIQAAGGKKLRAADFFRGKPALAEEKFTERNEE